MWQIKKQKHVDERKDYFPCRAVKQSWIAERAEGRGAGWELFPLKKLTLDLS